MLSLKTQINYTMRYNIGIKTIGNATLTAYDDKPILSTDPWLNNDPAYFGSWVLSYKIPDEEFTSIINSKYIWFSHGHPDHLNHSSLRYFKNNKILLSDHYGSRIKEDLITEGFDVSILPDRKWTQLSKNIRVFSIADYAQNSILLIDVSNKLFVNLNDAPPRYWLHTVKRIIRKYKESYLLKLFGWGDADMINYFDENGNHLPTLMNKRCDYGIGPKIYKEANFFGVTHVIPFSSHHQYKRTDSYWASKFIAPLDRYQDGFPQNKEITFIDAFVEINCENSEVRKINPKKNIVDLVDPSYFGDNWSDNLEKDDLIKIKKYFQTKEKLADFLGFINIRVGKIDNYIDINNSHKTGITFEVPRHSLMQAIEFKIFDDLLIGNFMKTTMHNLQDLYHPNFNFIVTKYADNGRAESLIELTQYFNHYKSRGLIDIMLTEFEKQSMKYLRYIIPSDGSFGKVRDSLIKHRKKYFGKI